MSSKLDDALSTLRSERPDPDAKARALLALRAPHRRSPRLAWAAAATVAVGAVAFASLPRPSYAAEVRTLVERLARVTNVTMRHYQVAGSGARSLILESKTLNKRSVDRFLDRTDGYAQYADERSTTDAFRDYAIREDRTRPKRRSAWVAPRFLAEARATNVRKSGDENVTVYTFDWARGRDQGTMRLTADARSGRVLSVRGLAGRFTDLECEWEYGTVTPDQVTFRADAGTPVYDLAVQRKSFLAALRAGSAATPVGRRSVRLLGVYGDEAGNLIALVEGVGPVRESRRRAPTLDGKAGAIFAMPLNGWENGFDVPFRIGERTILAVGGTFASVGSQAKELVVPVSFDGDHVHNAVFRDVPIVRTGDLLRLFTPENRPFWLTERSEGTPTHPGHVGG